MGKIAFFPLVWSVLKDPRVIFITILMILFVSIGNYVVTYRKKVHIPKQKKKAPAPAPAPKPEENNGEQDGEAAE